MRLLLLLTALGSQLPIVLANGPVVTYNKHLSDLDEEVICASEVSLDCTYQDQEGVERSCISKTFETPFLRLLEKDCKTIGDDGIMTATITMKMCNKNTKDKHNFHPNMEESKFEIIGEVMNDGFVDGYSVSQAIPLNTCKTMVHTRAIDVCERKKFPLQVTMNGNMPELGLRESWCYAFVHVKNKIKLYPDEVGDDPSYYAPSTAPLVVTEKKTIGSCSTLMKMSCTFTDDNGNQRSCIHQDSTNMLPIYIIDENECKNKKIRATITMSMCNDNASKQIKPKFKDEKKRPKFMFGEVILDDTNFDDVNQYSTNIAAQTCKTVTFTEDLDTCQNSISLTEMLKGKSAQNDCYGYLERKVYMSTFISPPEVLPTPEPTNVPSRAPTVEIETTAAPVSAFPDTCNPRDALITEVANPAGDLDVRFVEILFNDCAGRTIKDEILVVRWPRNFVGPPVTISLKGFTVPEDGFVVICASGISISGGICDSRNNSVGNNDGNDAVAVVGGLPDDPTDPSEFDIIDIYGIPNATGVATKPFDFQNGRAVRNKASDPEPSGEFHNTEWTIYPGENKGEVGPKGTDPRVWVEPLIITQIVDPLTGDESEPLDYADVPRFIDIYVPDIDRWGEEKVGDDLKLVLFHGDSEDPDFTTAVSLNDIDTIPSDGFIVVCNNAADDVYYEQHNNKKTFLCDLVVSELFDNREGDFGCDRAAIVHGDSTNYSIVDMFGSLAVKCDETQHDFTGRRGVRLTNSTYAEPTWNYYHWEIMEIASPEDIRPRGFDRPEGPCNPRDALITEVAHPAGAPGAKFVEIFFDDCAGRTIKDEIHVVRWPTAVSPITTDLTGYTVPADGFVVICASSISPLGTCDKINDNVGNNDGNDAVAVVGGLPDDPTDPSEFDIIDIYGIPGAIGDDATPFDFQNGRAVRNKTFSFYPEPSDEFHNTEWTIYPGEKKGEVGPKGTDPRVWVKPLIITEIIDPRTGDESEPLDYAAVPRFIEIYVPDIDRWGEEKVGDDLKLVLFHGDSEDPDFATAVSLNDIDIPSDGFIVVCNNAAYPLYKDIATFNVVSYRCDIVVSELFDNREGDFGCDRAAIVHGDSTNYFIVDMFGSIGPSCDNSRFTGGRGVRLTNSTNAEPNYSRYNWEITTVAIPEDGDPREWDNPAEVDLDPAPSPPSLAPHTHPAPTPTHTHPAAPHSHPAPTPSHTHPAAPSNNCGSNKGCGGTKARRRLRRK